MQSSANQPKTDTTKQPSKPSAQQTGGTDVLIQADQLSKAFPIHGGVLRRQVGAIKAVSDINLKVLRGETLGIVGESGCGKTTLGRTLVRLYEPTAGRMLFDGKDYSHLKPKDLFDLRTRMQMIFQDPFASLNPRMTVGKIIEEPLTIHHKDMPPSKKLERVAELLSLVGLRPDARVRFPHEFSGGQRQRIGIARALALNPELIVADESVSALDVSIQAQIINLLVDLQRKLNLTYIFISHDLSVVRYIADRIAVMYLGRLVEIGSSEQIYERPAHPYTKALLGSVPLPDPRLRGKKKILKGDVPSPANPPPGCVFHTRCPHADSTCKSKIPDLQPAGDGQVACHHWKKVSSEAQSSR